jgi:membrane-associated protease RseP (regulator of RpoE activity)
MAEESKGTDKTEDKVEPTVEELQKELAAAQAKVAETDKWKTVNAAKLEEADDLIKKREDAEAKKVEALKDGKEYQKLNEVLEAKVKELGEKVAGISELEAIKEKYTALEATRKAELLEQIPEEKRDKFKDFSVEALTEAVSLIPAEQKAPGSSTTTSKASGATGGTPASKWTIEAKTKFIEAHGAEAFSDLITKEATKDKEK